MSLGSFVNSCAYRLPRRIPLIAPRSFCPNCHTQLRWLHLIPVLSFVALRGRCRDCRAAISIMYPGMELLVGSVAVILFMRYGLSFTFLATAVFFLLMLLVALVDWNHLMIPNEVIVAGLLAGLLLKALSGYRDIPPALLASLLSLLTLFSVLVLGSYLFKKEVMGMGDVKLAAVIGLFVGFQGFLVSLWIASVVGSIYGGVAYLTKTKRTTQSSNCDIAEVQKIPFGSFLSLASFTVFLFQEQIQGVLDLWWISIS